MILKRLAHAEEHQLIARLQQSLAHEACGERQMMRFAKCCDIARCTGANYLGTCNNQRDFRRAQRLGQLLNRVVGGWINLDGFQRDWATVDRLCRNILRQADVDSARLGRVRDMHSIRHGLRISLPAATVRVNSVTGAISASRSTT